MYAVSLRTIHHHNRLRRYKSTASISEIIGQVLNLGSQRSTKELKFEYDTKKWLTNILFVKKKKPTVLEKENITLDLPIVLKKLQILRNGKQVSNYFQLLSILESSKVKWLSNSKKIIEKNFPIELYHESTKMVRQMTGNIQSPQLRLTLSKMAVSLIERYYTETTYIYSSKNVNSEAVIFLRNCLQLIVSSKSQIMFDRACNLIRDKDRILFLWLELMWLYETKQVVALSTELRRVLPELLDEKLEYNEVHVNILIPVFVKLFEVFVKDGNIEVSVLILRLLLDKWKSNMNESDLKKCILLKERFAI